MNGHKNKRRAKKRTTPKCGFYVVKNVSGSSHYQKSGGCLTYYKRELGLNSDCMFFCAKWECEKMARDGAHVEVVLPTVLGKKQYMIPLCSGCNSHHIKEPFFLKSGTILAAVNKRTEPQFLINVS